MYYTGVDPRDMSRVYVPKNPHEKALQRALIQYRDPKNYDLVLEALKVAGRTDLAGYDSRCLIRPRHRKEKDMETGVQIHIKSTPKPKKKKTIRNIHKKKVKK